jgi:hypothetical protein
MEAKRPSFAFSSKKETMGLRRIANIPEIANDQITPPNRSNVRLRIRITAAKRQPRSKVPAKQATNPRNFRCFSDRICGELVLSFMYLFLLFPCFALMGRINIQSTLSRFYSNE